MGKGCCHTIAGSRGLPGQELVVLNSGSDATTAAATSSNFLLQGDLTATITATGDIAAAFFIVPKDRTVTDVASNVILVAGTTPELFVNTLSVTLYHVAQPIPAPLDATSGTAIATHTYTNANLPIVVATSASTLSTINAPLVAGDLYYVIVRTTTTATALHPTYTVRFSFV